ncbi:hypothetical protein B4N89_46285 [Embleya scabrispora]|uniref:Uncharacterized protein n=1 Tax=Embleya scabrispora TaxID=159449 RepID=A0A1T3NIG4_9ACTN|nr:hypothetical protein [Embleya scabrispora]OPC76460.1 hypothetical protein B4N89_46285 [Embleya scabrispora]
MTAASSTTTIRRLWVHAIHSGQSSRSRTRHLADFENVPLLRSDIGPHDAVDGAVLANVRVLGEGVDVICRSVAGVVCSVWMRGYVGGLVSVVGGLGFVSW